MDSAAITRIAALLGDARGAARPVPPLTPAERPQSTADGYAVQKALSAHLVSQGQGAHIGWKVGATTADMQKYLKVDGPAYGRMLSANRYKPAATLPRAGFFQPGIECEIGVRIGRDASNGTELYDRHTIGALVEAVFPAIEIVENRYGDFLERGSPSMIADDFFHKACVPGAEITRWRNIDLAAVTGQTVIDGDVRGTGIGSEVMGHPLEAVAWLANTLTAHGERLSEGQIVLTGSIAPVIWLSAEDRRAEITIEGLGAVAVDFV